MQWSHRDYVFEPVKDIQSRSNILTLNGQVISSSTENRLRVLLFAPTNRRHVCILLLCSLSSVTVLSVCFWTHRLVDCLPWLRRHLVGKQGRIQLFAVTTGEEGKHSCMIFYKQNQFALPLSALLFALASAWSPYRAQSMPWSVHHCHGWSRHYHACKCIPYVYIVLKKCDYISHRKHMSGWH